MMRWPWRRRRAGQKDALAALAEANERLADARDRWPEVHEVTGRLRRAEQDRFKELFPELGGRP